MAQRETGVVINGGPAGRAIFFALAGGLILFTGCAHKKAESLPPYEKLVEGTRDLARKYPGYGDLLRVHLVQAEKDHERAAAQGSPEVQQLERRAACRHLWAGVSPLWQVDAKMRQIGDLASNFDRMTLSRLESPLRQRALQEAGLAVEAVRLEIAKVESTDQVSLERDSRSWLARLGQAHMVLHQAMRGFQAPKSKSILP